MHRTKRPPLPFSFFSSNSQDSPPTTTNKPLKVKFKTITVYIYIVLYNCYRIWVINLWIISRVPLCIARSPVVFPLARPSSLLLLLLLEVMTSIILEIFQRYILQYHIFMSTVIKNFYAMLIFFIQPYALPLVAGTIPDLKCISPKTVRMIMNYSSALTCQPSKKPSVLDSLLIRRIQYHRPHPPISLEFYLRTYELCNL